MLYKFSPFLGVALLFLVACDLLQPSSPVDQTPAVVTATPANTPVPVDTPSAAQPTAERILSLTIWLPPEIANRTEAGAAVFEQQSLAFRTGRPDVVLTIEQKAVSGQGGILSYLRTGHNIASAVLPDLIALPTSQLAAAANEELIYPIGDWLNPTLIDSLYPAARRLGQVEDELIGYPFALVSLPHLAYHTGLITTTLPLTWSELVSGTEAQFVFPGAGQMGATLLLQFYLASDGTLVNEVGQPALNVEALTAALTQFSFADSNGFLLPDAEQMVTPEEAWLLFERSSSLIVLTTSGQFLSFRSPAFAPGYGAIPGVDEPLTPLLSGWAWAISTTDPTRRALALEFVTLLAASENLGAWSAASNILPAHPGAFDYWLTGDAYAQFVQEELARADAFPSGANSDMLAVFQTALLNVIALGMTPQTAAEQAVSSLQP